MSAAARRNVVRARRRGSAYVLVLTVSMLVVTIAVAGLTADRIQDRKARLEQDWHGSGLLAEAAVERALHETAINAWWRDDFRDYESQFTPGIDFGEGSLSWRFEDLVDSDLDDHPADPVRIHGLGRVGGTVRVYSVLVWPTGLPIDALRTAIHAGGDLEVNGVLDVRAGPASSNGTVLGEQVLGDVEASQVDPVLAVTGSVVAPAPIKAMPPEALWEVYTASSVEIPYGSVAGNIQKVVIGPARNPYDANKIQADGLYKIKVPNYMLLKIRQSRVEGTLLVELGIDSDFTIDFDVLWHPARPDFPALIVYGKHPGNDVDIICSGELDEFLLATNFNPPDTPYFGDADTDQSDSYPASLSGVFHIIRKSSSSGTVTVDAPNRITGCILADGDIHTVSGSIVMANSTLLSRPPLGYTTLMPGENLLVNGDMEGGPTGWVKVGAPTTLAYEGPAAHSGAKGLKVKDRGSPSHGVRQDVTGSIESEKTYVSDVWIKKKDDPEDVQIILVINSSGEGTQNFIAVAPQVQTSWTHVTVQHTPIWTGTLNSARWKVRTTTTAQEFSIDDASLAPVLPGPPPATMLPVPGTWRAEAAPQ